MGGDGRKRKVKKTNDKTKKSSQRGGAPATVVVDLHLDLRGLTVLPAGAADPSGRGRPPVVDPPVVPVARAVPTGAAAAAEPATASGPAIALGPVPADQAVDPAGGPVAGRADVAGPSWPLGPHYLRWVEGKGADAWARFKLRSADWYLEALEFAEREVGLDRFVGVEMAIDGVLSSLCAGVDAAAQALLEEVERFAGPSPLRTHRPAADDWTVLVALAEGAGIELASARPVVLAVRGSEDETEGWLTQLQRLRTLAVRRNVLVRRPNVDGAARSRLLEVPGLGQRPVVRYLHATRRRADGLVEALLADVDSLARERQRPGPRAGAGRLPLPDLAARADLLGARWRSSGTR